MFNLSTASELTGAAATRRRRAGYAREGALFTLVFLPHRRQRQRQRTRTPLAMMIFQPLLELLAAVFGQLPERHDVLIVHGLLFIVVTFCLRRRRSSSDKTSRARRPRRRHCLRGRVRCVRVLRERPLLALVGPRHLGSQGRPRAKSLLLDASPSLSFADECHEAAGTQARSARRNHHDGENPRFHPPLLRRRRYRRWRWRWRERGGVEGRDRRGHASRY